MGTKSWRRWQNTARKKRMQPKRSNGKSENPRQQCCWNIGSGKGSMPSLRALPKKEPGSVFCLRRLKEGWQAVWKGWMSVTGCGYGCAARMWSEDLLTSRRREGKHEIEDWCDGLRNR